MLRASGPDDPGAERLDHLIEEAPQVAAPLLQGVEQSDAREGVGPDERIDEAGDGLRVGQAEEVPDPSLVERIGR